MLFPLPGLPSLFLSHRHTNCKNTVSSCFLIFVDKLGINSGSSIQTGMRLYADGSGFLYPFLGSEDKPICAGRGFNPIEFDGIKTRIVELFPYSKVVYRVFEPQPVAYYHVSADWVGLICLYHVRKADVVALIEALHYTYGLVVDGYLCCLGHILSFSVKVAVLVQSLAVSVEPPVGCLRITRVTRVLRKVLRVSSLFLSLIRFASFPRWLRLPLSRLGIVKASFIALGLASVSSLNLQTALFCIPSLLRQAQDKLLHLRPLRPYFAKFPTPFNSLSFDRPSAANSFCTLLMNNNHNAVTMTDLYYSFYYQSDITSSNQSWLPCQSQCRHYAQNGT